MGKNHPWFQIYIYNITIKNKKKINSVIKYDSRF